MDQSGTMKQLFPISLILILFIACQSSTSEPQDPEAGSSSKSVDTNWQLTTSEGINIHHPGDWEVDVSGFMGSKFLLYWPQVEGDAFRENINLTSQSLPEKISDLAEVGEATAGQLSTFVTNAKLQSQGLHADGGHYELQYSGSQGNSDLTWYQRLYLAEDQLYALTYTADRKDFDTKLDAAKKCMDTFRLP